MDDMNEEGPRPRTLTVGQVEGLVAELAASSAPKNPLSAEQGHELPVYHRQPLK